jgi:thiamine-phosphate pyrophosphorylase
LKKKDTKLKQKGLWLFCLTFIGKIVNDTFISYLITDPKYYTNNPKIFKEKLFDALQNHHIDYACFRDKTSENFEELAAIFVQVCQTFHIEQILINKRIDIARQVGATGVHLTSTQFEQIAVAKANDLYTIISTHSLNEIEKAQDAHANAVTYSPIFQTPNKGEPKGIDALKTAISFYDIDIIALGGIVHKNQIEAIEKTSAKGFASIRYFVK